MFACANDSIHRFMDLLRNDPPGGSVPCLLQLLAQINAAIEPAQRSEPRPGR